MRLARHLAERGVHHELVALARHAVIADAVFEYRRAHPAPAGRLADASAPVKKEVRNGVRHAPDDPGWRHPSVGPAMRGGNRAEPDARRANRLDPVKRDFVQWKARPIRIKRARFRLVRRLALQGFKLGENTLRPGEGLAFGCVEMRNPCTEGC